jgi:putative ABC transport system permease protein
MIKHYFKIAIRSLRRQKVLSFINVLGLSLGLACFILFLLYSVNEFSFDRFHKQADDIYRVYRWTEAMNGEDASGDVYLPMPLGPALKQDLPDVQEFVRMQEAWGESYVRIDNKVSRIRFSFADPQFFSVFDFKFRSGNPANALNDIHSVVLTQKIARQLFGSQNAVGKTFDIKWDDQYEPFTVSAVVEDLPSNSSITFEMLGNYGYLPTTKNGKRSVDNWRRSSYFTFVRLREGSTLAKDPQRLLGFRRKYYPDEEAELRKDGYWKGKGAPVTYGMQPLLSIHTDTKVWGGIMATVDPGTIWLLLAIAGGVLLIACINFTTLSIGRSAARAREIGIRKVVGSMRFQLMRQFLAEAFIMTLISVVLGLVLARLLLPAFNQLSGKELQFSFGQYPEMIWLLVALTLVVSLIAGSYPSLVLSSFNPIEVLKQKVKVGGSNFFTRSLVTLQFVLSIGLIAATMIILQQTKYMTSKNPGFNKEQVLVVNASGAKTEKIYPLFKQEVIQQPLFAGIAASEQGLGANAGWSRNGFDYKGTLKQVYEYYIDQDYIPLMGMQLVAGRNFTKHIAADTVNSIIVNEAMVRDFGWTLENAVGQELPGYQPNNTTVVVGVVKDFNFRALRNEIEPQIFHMFHDYAPYKFFVKLKPGNPSKAIASLEKTWAKLVPDIPFKYSFLDEDLERFYESEVRWSNIIGWAGGISIFLAALGLFGLAALAVVNRTKEIGIRKVLGASLAGIVGLLTKDFLKLIIIALVIATPLAWYFMNQWLQDFAYRISIGWWIFLVAGSLSLIIAFLTIGYQALKAGLMNPVKSLRTE